MSFARGKGRGSKYGAQHQAERRARAAGHQPTDPCVRCGHPLGPMGPHLHLDHAEHGGYLGFSHGGRCPICRKRCNVSAGASKGARTTNARRRTSPLRW